MKSAGGAEKCQRTGPRVKVKRRREMQQLAIAGKVDRAAERLDPYLGRAHRSQGMLASCSTDKRLREQLRQIARAHGRRVIRVQQSFVEPRAASECESFRKIFVVAN